MKEHEQSCWKQEDEKWERTQQYKNENFRRRTPLVEHEDDDVRDEGD